MEELDQNLKSHSANLILASSILCLISLIMIRFGYNHPKNEIWSCVLFALKVCSYAWTFILGRYSAKEIFRERAATYELKLTHSQGKINEQKLRSDEILSQIQQKSDELRSELSESKRREEALLQKLKAIQKTPNDANQDALRSFV
jgi:hypothetical protein